jgi:hypothetical protein
VTTVDSTVFPTASTGFARFLAFHNAGSANLVFGPLCPFPFAAWSIRSTRA